MTNMGHLHASQTSWIQDKAAKEIKEATRMRNNITNVEEFANNVSEESLEKMKYLHAGDIVAYQPYSIGRIKFDDAHEFKPERWFHHNGCFHPFKFTAFQVEVTDECEKSHQEGGFASQEW
ncbi:hypothetical protein L1987_73154 [Smallanthus sonchifolius]|uniref:Uncharacterized protein n=1 Tax=Smallanthus sonchifolius TaxID=185202 RepID=A0ACB9A0T8_9ASTR|nr:hypothetical protein L1987_73154 [Smallanthus sonchifolius]